MATHPTFFKNPVLTLERLRDLKDHITNVDSMQKTLENRLTEERELFGELKLFADANKT